MCVCVERNLLAVSFKNLNVYLDGFLDAFSVLSVGEVLSKQCPKSFTYEGSATGTADEVEGEQMRGDACNGRSTGVEICHSCSDCFF